MVKFFKLCWCVCLGLFLLATCLVGAQDPYENLIIEVKHELRDCRVILDNLQPLLDAASEKLNDSTNGALVFSKATVVVPLELAYECGVDPGSSMNLTDLPTVHLTLGQDHPVFGKNPWTQQTQGCGKPGDFLYLPYTFLSEGLYEDKASLLMHEWAKFRWGVFEEYGMEGDPVYPLSYPEDYTPEAGILWKPSYCVDSALSGHFRTDCEYPDCPFELDSSQLAMSSILALPNVESITQYCDQATHLSSVPTKHNALCKGESVWDIVAAHPDGQRKSVTYGSSVDIEYAVLDNSTSRQYVLLIDQTKFFGNIKGRWEMLLASLKQWIIEDVLEGSKVGLVTFDLRSNLLYNMTLIDLASRQSIVDAFPVVPGVSLEKRTAEALSFVTHSIIRDQATIILIVDPNNLDLSDSEESLIEAAGSKVVWPILYPVQKTTDPEHIFMFQSLATKTGGQMLIVKDMFETDGNERQSIHVQRTLVQHLRFVQECTLPPFSHRIQIRVLHHAVRSIYSTFTILLGDNVDLSQPLVLFIYSHMKPTKLLLSSSMHQELTLVNVTDTSFKTEINSIQKGKLSITIEFPIYFEDHWVEFLGMQTENVVSAKFWASHDLNFIKLDQPTDPVVFFAKIASGKLPVIGADVTVLIQSEDKSDMLVLRDKGGGPDITGNDGIYTAYWTLAPSGMNVVYSIILSVRSNDFTQIIGEDANSEGIVCCGSTLNLNAVDRKPISVSFDQMVGVSYVSSDAGHIDVFPPARVVDLRGFVDFEGINLTFTAPGDDLNRGYAFQYLVWWLDILQQEWLQVLSIQYEVVEGGSFASVVFVAPACDQVIQYRVTAKDTRLQEGDPSNIVSVILPCDWKPKPKHVQEMCPNSDHIYAGIFFGGFVMGIIVVLIGLFIYKKRPKTILSNDSALQFQVEKPENITTTDGDFTNTGNVLSVKKPKKKYIIKRSDSEIIKRENKNRQLPFPPIQDESVIVNPSTLTAAMHMGNTNSSSIVLNLTGHHTSATTDAYETDDSFSSSFSDDAPTAVLNAQNGDTGDIYEDADDILKVNRTSDNIIYEHVDEIDHSDSNLNMQEQNPYQTVAIHSRDEIYM